MKIKTLFSILMSLLMSSDIYCQVNTDDKILFVSAKSGLKLRSSPDVESEIIDIAEFGDAVEQIEIVSEKVNINGEVGKWSKVSYRGKVGFMFNRYLSRLGRIDLQLLGLQPDSEYPIYALSKYFRLMLYEIADSSERIIKNCEDDPDCKYGIFETTRYFNKNFQLVETHSWDSMDEKIIGKNWSFNDAKDLVDWMLIPMWEGKFELSNKNGSSIYSDKEMNYSIVIKKISNDVTSIRWETSH